MPSDVETRPIKKIKAEVSPAVAHFFTKASEKPKSELQWHIHDQTLLCGKYKAGRLAGNDPAATPRRIKIAAFDLDGTLIKTKQGGRFPKDEADWKFFDISVPLKLQRLHEAGHQVVVFSNQAGLKLTDSAKRYTQFKLKLEAITSRINIPLNIYAASEHDIFRKPRIGMMERYILDLKDMYPDENLDIQLSKSFFVGDAAGRPAAAANVRQDFSASDRKFALNVGLTFHSPEEYFLSKASRDYELTGFDPLRFKNPLRSDHLFVRGSEQEIILFVGSPAAGKSTYYKTFLQPLEYVRINQDTLKTRQKCLVRAREELVTGKSVCIDNTNANKETRADWLLLARQIGDKPIPVRVIHFTASADLCAHNNAVRAFAPKQDEEKRDFLPAVAFTSYTGRYEPPMLEEGFTKLEKVEFMLTGSLEQQETWRQYWT